MRSSRIGLAKGQGRGYKNINRADPVIHSRAGKGMKTYSSVAEKRMMLQTQFKKEGLAISKTDHSVEVHRKDGERMNPAQMKLAGDVVRGMDLFQLPKHEKKINYWKFPKGQPAPNNYVWDGTGWIKNPTIDSDGDGVPDYKDCQPNDPSRQGSNRDVMEAFNQGDKDESGSMRSDGKTIYSYSTPIATRLDDGTVLFNTQKYSPTTSKQQTQLRRAISGSSIKDVSEKELKDSIMKEQQKPRPELDFQRDRDRVLPGKTIDLREIKIRNDEAGFHFFDKSSMRFFDSKHSRNVYVDQKGEFGYFTTSEQFHSMGGGSEPRKYTVRKANLKTGNVDTVGDFNTITTNEEATRQAKNLAKI